MDEFIDYVDEIEEEYVEFEANIGRIRAFAVKAHGSQKDKNGLPYATHLDAVARNTVKLFGFDPTLVITAYLHDVVEDTKYSQDDIDATFPAEISDAIYAITKVSGKPNHEYIGEVAKEEVAAKVKLADLMHNTQPDRLAKLPESQQRRLKKKYFPAIYRLCKAVGIEPWVSHDEAVAAIHADSTLATKREITVGSLMKGDRFQFVENGDLFNVEKVSSAISGPGYTSRDVTMAGGDTLRIKAALKVILHPRIVTANILSKQVADYMGEAQS